MSERIFTEAIGRFHKGDIRDYPRHTWQGIEKSVGRPLDTFTQPVSQAAKVGVGVMVEQPKAETMKRVSRGVVR